MTEDEKICADIKVELYELEKDIAKVKDKARKISATNTAKRKLVKCIDEIDSARCEALSAVFMTIASATKETKHNGN